MKAKKIFNLIISALLIFPLVVSMFGAMTAHAQDTPATTVDVTLHKRAWNGERPSNIQNTGKIMSFGGVPLNDVTFAAYDVTNQYHDYVTEGMTPQEAVEEIQKDALNGVPSYLSENEFIASEVTANTDNYNGVAVFEGLALEEDSRHKVYLFIETDAPSTVKEYAMPIVLAMPIYEVDDEGKFTDTLNEDIHLYPKNFIKDDIKEITSEFEKIIINEGTENEKEVYNVHTGDVIDYTITVNVPRHIAQLETFIVEDVPTEGLELVAGSIDIPSLEADDYEIVTITDTPGFQVIFTTQSANLKALAGELLTIEYKMVLTNDINPDSIFDNEARITLGNSTHEVPGPPVATGGYKFIKTDATTGAGLANAEFIVTKGTGEEKLYAKFQMNENEEYAFTGWYDTESEATHIVSAEEGILNIIGLTDGTYQLTETKAPSENYVKLPDPINFTVKHGTYGNMELATPVPNTPKGLLPETGGPGILGFLAIGLGLMLGAFIWYKKSKEVSA